MKLPHTLLILCWTKAKHYKRGNSLTNLIPEKVIIWSTCSYNKYILSENITEISLRYEYFAKSHKETWECFFSLWIGTNIFCHEQQVILAIDMPYQAHQSSTHLKRDSVQRVLVNVVWKPRWNRVSASKLNFKCCLEATLKEYFLRPM
jgi:hypothetical protein